MGGLFHPIGPEAEETYWLRRGAVLIVLVAVLVGAGFMISSISQAISGPAQPAAAPPADPAAPAPAPADETPAPTPAPEPAATTPAAAPSTPAATQPAATQPPASQPAPSAPATSAPRPAPSQAPASFEVGSPQQPAGQQPAGQQPAGQPQACDRSKLRVGLDGPRQVSAGVPVNFRVTVGNDSGQRCRLVVDDKTFELKIYSGTDRIWTTLDCLSGMPAKNLTLDPGQEFGWEQEWRANRSVGDCKAGAETLRSGTYVATAQLKDAQPVQVIMQLRG
ncbi:hypothetical protein [Enemella evansiae]|nr:hypothetical protein [Enemella evansiae]TDO84773.1 hypothetical protein C8D81_4126 [Enemella evansiae]